MAKILAIEISPEKIDSKGERVGMPPCTPDSCSLQADNRKCVFCAQLGNGATENSIPTIIMDTKLG